MQLISSFDEKHAQLLQSELDGLKNPFEGMTAEAAFMPNGWFAVFSWPDWPKAEADRLRAKIEEFHRAHPELTQVSPESPESPESPKCPLILRGRKPDYDSAEAIAGSFNKHFANGVKWVESEKDTRGRIGAVCYVETVGRFNFDLNWRYSSITPVAMLSDASLQAFRKAGKEVMDWAESRIRPILDILKSRLQELYGDRFRGLYVFGSYAKPDAGIRLPEDSDLDVALLLSDLGSPYDEIQRFGHITADLSLEHDLVISLVPIRESDFREGQTNFTRVISEYAIPVI